MPLKFSTVAAMIILVLGLGKVQGATRYSMASGNWNSTATWVGSIVPVAGDVVFIEPGDAITVTANAACASVTFTGNGATLTVNSTFTLTVSDAITVNSATGATYSTTLGGSGTITCTSLAVGINLTPGSDQTTTLTTNVSNLSISGNLSLYSSDDGNRQNNATFNHSSGSVTVGGSITSTNDDTGQNTSTFTMAMGNQNGVLNLTGTTPFNLGSGTNAIDLSGTSTLVNYSYSGPQTVYGVSYTDLTLSGSGTKTLQTGTTTTGGDLILSGTVSATTVVALTIAGNLDIGSGASLTITGINFSVTGPTSVSGTITHNNTAGTKTFSGNVTVNNGGIWNETAAEAISFAGNLINNGTFTASSGSHTFTGTSVTLGGSNNLSIPSIAVNGTTTNTAILTVSTTLSGIGTLINGTNATLNFGGATIAPTITATAIPNTVHFNGGAQTVKPTSYVNLTLSGSAVKTTASVTVNGILSMEGSATVTAAPTYGAGATLRYNTSTSHTAGAEWETPFTATGGVIVANSGTITMNGAKVFNASIPLTINSGASLSTGNFQLTLGGDFINNGGTFSAGSSPIVMTNTMSSQNIAGFSTTGLVSMTKSWGTATLQGNIGAGGLTISGSGGTLNLGTALNHAINGAVSISGNTLSAGSSTTAVTGDWTYNSGTFNSGTGTVNFNGSAAQIIEGTLSTTFNNFAITNGSGVTVSTNITVAGNLNLNNGIVSNGTYTITITNTSNSAVAGGSTSRFLNGPLIWSHVAGQNYIFPVGKGSTYMPFELSAPTGTTLQVRIEAFAGNTGGSASSPLTSLSTSEYWLASVASGTYGGGSVSLTRQTALNELDAIGRSSTLAGVYSSLQGTVSGTSIINSDNTGNSLGYFVMASNRSITTGTISPDNFCPGSAVAVPYTKTGNFNSGNIFTAQLSNASGSFASPTNIGSLTSQNSGTINATIPVGQTTGSGYRIRVISSNPAVTGSDNGANIFIGTPSISSTFPGSRCGPGPVTLSAIANAGTINWYAALTGGSSLGTGTTFTTPSLSTSTTYYVDATLGSCVSTPRVAVLATIITPPTITAGGGGTFCPGSTVYLTSSGTNLTNQYWQGPNNFYSLDQNPVLTNVTPAMSGTYTVTGSALSGINLVTNGDFELGDMGFTSSYISSTDLYPEGTYAVVANPNSVHPNFAACTDHTPSGTLQMVINGATVAGVNIWSQTVNVNPGTDYQFTYWIQSVVASNPSQLQLYANGSPAGPVYTAITSTCQWAQFLYNWNSGTSTSAVLSLVNQNTIASGNDFTLDDINFQQACSATQGDFSFGGVKSQPDAPMPASVVVTVNAVATTGAIGSNQAICSGATPAPLTSVAAGTGSGTISYEWQTNASGNYVTISGATLATYSPPALAATTSFQRRTVSLSDGVTCYSAYGTPVTITVTGPTSQAGGPNAVCQSASPVAITLSGASFGGGSSTAAWSIIFGGGTLSSTAYTSNPSAVTYTPAANFSGTATLRLTTNVVGGCAAISIRTINVPAAPAASAGTAVITCSNSGAVNITAGASAGNYTSITWTSGGTGSFTNSNSLTTATYTPSAADISAGSVVLTLTATGNTPCGNAISTKTLTITTLPAATISYGGTPYCQSVATSQPVTRTGTAGGIYTASPAGLTINSSTGAVTPSTSTAGSYTVTYTIAASGGCAIVTATTPVTVTAVPTATISYAGSPFCISLSSGQPVTLSGTGAYTGGTYTAAPAGLSINSGTGAVTPSSSTAGTYTVTYTIPASGGCSAVPVTSPVTITTLPVATFSYAGSPYCSNAANPLPTFSGGGVAGTFSSTTGLVFLNTATGLISIAASTPGTYSVTNTIAASAGCAQVTANSPITINTLPAATISYAGSPFCKSLATAQPVTRTGTSGGTYSASPAGLSINGSTGEITPSTSTAGSYTVTYTIAASGGCAIVTATTPVTVTAVPTATISYAGSPFCISLSSGQPVTLNGTGAYTSGTYTAAPAGLSINSGTGAVTPSSSTAGTYTVTYTIPASGGCSAVPVTSPVTITALPVATFSYAGSPYCSNAANPLPTFSGGGVAGIFSSTPGLVFVNIATGQIDMTASSPGSYVVTNTIAASGGCDVVIATSGVVIHPSAPAAPGPISGNASICPALAGQTYSVSSVPNATSYSWTVPTGWSITGGAGTNTITVTTGSAGQNGNITVSAVNYCGNSPLSTLAVTVNPGTPNTPGAISGTASQCPGLTGQVYSIYPVPDATIYSWTVPAGWTITGSSGSTSIIVTTGTAGQNGDITVTAGNSCGTSTASLLAVTVGQPVPVTPGAISGMAQQCPGLTGQIYSIEAVPNTITYNWILPAGWAITSGTGTNSITVTTGTAGQDGTISVTAGNDCGTGEASLLNVFINPAAPGIPGTISGSATQCPGLPDQVYSVDPVANATTYTWNVPAGWTITSGAGTPQIFVITGNASQSGTITVIAGNSCGNSEASTLTVSINQIEVNSSTGLALVACYPTVKAAFDRINDGTHTGTIVIKVNGSTVETATASLNASVAPANYSSVHLYPTASGLSISGSLAAPLISLTGADNVTIDGRVNATGSTQDLTIINNSVINTTSNSTIRFINNATLNTIKYCSIQGSSPATPGGILLFHTSGSFTGNSNNTIENNFISTSPAGRPVYAIYSAGTAGRPNIENNIANNQFFNFLRPNTASYGIFLSTNTSAWIISGNSFYETSPFIPSGNVEFDVIRISNTGNDFTVTGNFIGGQTALCGGGPWTKTNAQRNTFFGIYLNVGTTVSSNVDGNTISNFAWSNSATAVNWTGIHVAAGDVNIGSMAGNTIGAAVGTGSITVTSAATNANVYGINIAGTGAVEIQNNTIGSITAATSTTALAIHFYGINKTSSSGNLLISSNFIGSESSTGSISATSPGTANAQMVYGIKSAGTGTTTISNNVVANIINAYSGTLDAAKTQGINVSAGVNLIEGNTVHHISTASGQINGGITGALMGISTTSTTPGQTIQGNTIYTLSDTHPTARMDIYGIYFTGPATGPNLITGNFIHSLALSTSNANGDMDGIVIDAGAVSVTNNIIHLGNGLEVGYMIYGISDVCALATDQASILFNTIYISGNVTPGTTNPTYGVFRYTSAGISNYLNNNIFNARSGGASGHYAIGLAQAVTTGLTMDYNNYYTTGANGMPGNFGGSSITTIAAWRTSTGQDVNSLSIDPLLINAGSSIPADYKPMAALPALTGTGITTDFGSNIRRIPPTMGAWERLVLIRKWKGNISTDFATGNNWTDGTVPSSGDDIIFEDDPDRHCILDGNRTAGTIANAQSTDYLITNGHQLTILGNLSFSNGAQIDASVTGSEVVFGGISQQSIPAGTFTNNEVNNLTIQNTNNVPVSGTLRLTGVLLTPSGLLDALTSSPTIEYGGSLAQGIDKSSFTGSTLYNLTVDNGTGLTMTSDLIIQHNLSINPGKKFIVPSTKALTVLGTLTNNGGNEGFTLESDPSGTASLLHNSTAVSATVRRFISGSQEAWHFLSTPVETQDIVDSWIPSGTYGNGTGYDLYIWDEPTSCWVYKLNTTSTTNWPLVHPQSYFIPGKGYLYSFQEANPTKQFAGNLNNGTVSYPLTNVSTEELLHGFNLVGNPYPSSIDWKAGSGWTRSLLVNSGGGYDMWIWNPAASNYGVYNSQNPGDVGTNNVTRYLAPMQGYFVRAAASGDFVTTNDVRTHQGAWNWIKGGDIDDRSVSLVVNSNAGTGFDEVSLAFGYQANEDGALKLFSKVAAAPGLFMPAGDRNLSVRYLTLPQQNPVVPVMFKPGHSGEYSLTCRFNQDEFETIMLEDRSTGYIQNLISTPVYTFRAEVDDDPSRFILHFGPSDPTDPYVMPARIYPSNGHLVADLTLIREETVLSVFDIAGRILMEMPLTGLHLHSIDLSLPSQVLVIHLNNELGTKSRKIIWRNE